MNMRNKSKILIIIPAYNEEKNIESVVNNIIENYPQYDYVIVNDGSKDGTEKICLKKRYNVLNLAVNLGIGGAVQAGYLYAVKEDYDIAIQIDGDGQHNVSDVEKVIAPILEGSADVSIGSRFVEKEGFQTTGSRRIGIKILSGFIQICTGNQVRDVTSGFRAVNKRFIKIYAEDYPFDYPEPEALVSAIVYGGKIAEVPVIMNKREMGESSINFKRSVYYMIKVTIAIFIRRIGYGIRRAKKGEGK